MAKQPAVLERDAILALPQVQKDHKMGTRKESASPEMDRLLENTLVSDISIGRSLTRREAQILQLIASGRTNKEIGRMLCRTERTVEYHRNKIYRKLGAHNAAELVRLAIAMGII